MLRFDLVGTWNLVSYEIDDAPGKRKPWSEDAKGLMLITPEGKFSIAICSASIDRNEFHAGSFYIEGTSRLVMKFEFSTNPYRLDREELLDSFRELKDEDLLILAGRANQGAFRWRWVRP